MYIYIYIYTHMFPFFQLEGLFSDPGGIDFSMGSCCTLRIFFCSASCLVCFIYPEHRHRGRNTSTPPGILLNEGLMPGLMARNASSTPSTPKWLTLQGSRS